MEDLMKDRQGDFQPSDPGRINPNDPVEIRYWCQQLGCTDEQLNQALTKVGDHVAAVREYLESSE
jgi:hypothetical protein